MRLKMEVISVALKFAGHDNHLSIEWLHICATVSWANVNKATNNLLCSTNEDSHCDRETLVGLRSEAYSLV